MSIRTDDLGFVFYEADEQEEKELEYVYAITDSWNYMGDEVIDTFPRRFWDRVCQEKIKAPFTKEMFLQETDIIATIKGFGLDVNKFWWAVLFVYDWSIEKFTKCFWVKLPPKSLTKILDYIGDSKDFEITFRVKGKKSREADPNVKAAVMYGLRQKLKEWKDKEFYRIIDHSTYTTTFTNSSYYMCFAADKFKHLFDALKLPNRGAKPADLTPITGSHLSISLCSCILSSLRSSLSMKGAITGSCSLSCLILSISRVVRSIQSDLLSTNFLISVSLMP